MKTSNAALLAFLDRLPIAVVIADTTTAEILWVNGPHTALSGASSPAQIVGHSLFEFLAPEQLAVAMRDLEAVTRGESPAPVVYHVRRLDGGAADVHIASTPIVFGRRQAMVSMVTDVTDGERTIADLARREARYRRIADGAPWGVMVVRGQEVVYANASAALILGAASPEILVHALAPELFGVASWRRLREAREGVLSGGQAISETVLDLDGASSPVRVHAVLAPLEWDGEPAFSITLRASRSSD